jgi:hypothetical protein
LDYLAHPTGFEPVTSAFGALRISAKKSVKQGSFALSIPL